MRGVYVLADAGNCPPEAQTDPQDCEHENDGVRVPEPYFITSTSLSRERPSNRQTDEQANLAGSAVVAETPKVLENVRGHENDACRKPPRVYPNRIALLLDD